MDWSKLPDLIAVALLAWAFASVVRRSRAPVFGNWLNGWLLILLHFAASMFLPAPGLGGKLASAITIISLVWAGILFMRASLPYRKEISSFWMMIVLLATYTFYIVSVLAGSPLWLLNVAAVLLFAGPLAVALLVSRRFRHPLRWSTIAMNASLAIVLLFIQRRPRDGYDLALDAVVFTVYFGCCIHFWFIYPRATAGAFITVGGFFVWASVFVIDPILSAYFQSVHVENEVWNLPKYVVAVGMILLMLEDQIAYNKHLALHDELTGLPNRRLFQDRLANALERARRTESQAALLMLDLDHFKQVNDTLGHHVGDLLLQHVAGLFGRRVRRSDSVARTGGDEFAIVLDSPTSRSEALHVGHSLLDLLKTPMQMEGFTVQVGASIGIAVYPDDAQDMDSLCIAADLRMYEDKRAHATNDRAPTQPPPSHRHQPPPQMGIPK